MSFTDVLKGGGVGPSFGRGWLTTMDSLEVGARTVSGKIVAYSAKVLEYLLSLTGISSLLLLCSHLVVYLLK